MALAPLLRTFKFSSRSIYCCLVGCLFGTATTAEQAAVYSRLQGVTATATKGNRDPFTVAESVSVVGREEVERRQAVLLSDLLKDLPNVDIGGGPRGIAQEIVIRGVSDERILFLLDGARQNFTRAHNGRVFVDPELLKQVEVLRGPASALWGSGAIGGVVALTTVDAADLLSPGDTFGARFKLGYQDVNNLWRSSASAYGLIGDSVDLLADVSYRDANDTDLGDGTTLERSAFDALSGLFKFTWSPTSEHNVAATAQMFDEDGAVPSNPQIASTPDDLVDRETEQRNLSLRYTFEPADSPLLRPSVVLYRNETDISERRLVDGRQDDTEVTTWGVDLRNRFAWGSDAIGHVLTAGVDYFEDEAEASRDGMPRPSFPSAKQSVLGAYLHDEIRLMRRLTLVPGLRWDSYESESEGDSAADQDESEWSAKLAASFALTDWLTLHAAYNEAFRAPNVNELFVSGTHFTCGPGCANLFVPNPALKPEKARNLEFALGARKSGLFQAGDQGRARFAVFRNDIDDFIDQVVNFSFAPVPGNPGPGGVSTFENVANARLEGFEIELAYDAPTWFAKAGYGRTRGEDRDTGEHLARIPADALTLGVGVKLEPVTLGWRARFVDEQDRVPDDVAPTGSYDLHDIYLTWKPQRFGKDKLRIDLGVDNLFDEDYRPHLSLLNGPGRNVKATVAVAF